VLRKKIKIYVMILFLTIMICTSAIFGNDILNLVEFSRAALSYYGSSGQEVIDLQAKLYNWGYYNGIVDGNYGYETYQAVKSFQSKNGLNSIDGVAGPETLGALGLPTGTPASSTGNNTSNSDINLLAHLIYGEARGEPYIGQVAVGAVILNRTRDDRFPKTIAGVIYQPGAFDAFNDGQINLSPDNNAFNAAQDAINGWDPSYGCVYYYNPSTATSSWIWSKTIILKIGNHNFAK
jgi:N-acetylmuramoyl-L-alanine amidase